jgi:mRNA interferase RelE/StbE
VSDQLPEDLYELRTTRRALGEVLPEAVAAAAYKFITAPLLREPYRVGKRLLPPMDDRFSARRGTYRIIYRPGEVCAARARYAELRLPTGKRAGQRPVFVHGFIIFRTTGHAA